MDINSFLNKNHKKKSQKGVTLSERIQREQSKKKTIKIFKFTRRDVARLRGVTIYAVRKVEQSGTLNMKDLKSVARYVMRGDPAILRKKIKELYKRIYFMRRWRRKKKAKKAMDRRFDKRGVRVVTVRKPREKEPVVDSGLKEIVTYTGIDDLKEQTGRLIKIC
jgi:methionine aminopeptidase